MLAVERSFKFEGMGRAQDFIIYPTKIGQSSVILQGNSRIIKVDLVNGTGILSKQCPRGAYFVHLNEMFGAKEIKLTQAQLDEILSMQVKMSKGTNPDGTMTIDYKVTYE